MSYVFAVLAPLLVAALAFVLNLPQALGAHPWWSQNVILIGAPAGVILGAILGAVPLHRAIGAAIAAIGAGAAFVIATTGKARFAASYAEDTFGGDMWYFGWIATCALTAALIAVLLWPKHAKH